MARRTILAAGALAALLCACASDPAPPPRHGHGGPPAPDHRPRCAPLFASPAGEPFRARFGDAACPIDAWFTGADLDHDGALTPDEFRRDALRFFAVLDVDGDGVISSLEVRRYEEGVFPEILSGPGRRAEAASPFQRVALLQGPGGGLGGGGGRGGGGGGGRGGHGGRGGQGPGGGGGFSSAEGAARFSLLDEAEPVTGSDINLDGRITRAEFAKSAEDRFKLLDPDGKGRLLLADLKAHAPTRGGPGQRRGAPRQKS